MAPPPLPPRWRPQRWLSQFRPRRPPRLLIALPRRCPVSPLPLLSVLCCPTPPLRSLPLPPPPHPPLSPIPPTLRRSTRRFHLRSTLRPLPPRGTPPLLCRCLPDIGAFPGPVLGAPVPSSSSPPSSASPPPARRSSALLRDFYSPLLRLPHPRHPLGSCSRSPHPACPFPCPWPQILPIRTKMLEIGRAGVMHDGWWQANPRHA